MGSEMMSTKCQQVLMLIFSTCVYLINVAKWKFDPNENIIMNDLSSNNLLNLVLLTATLVTPCTPLRSKQENLFCTNNEIDITESLIFVDLVQCA